MIEKDFAPFCLEAHGRWGAEAVATVRALAARRAAALALPVSQECVRWYAHIAVALQLANAKMLRGSLNVDQRPMARSLQARNGYRDLSMA